jgi:hypothetical protein
LRLLGFPAPGLECHVGLPPLPPILPIVKSFPDQLHRRQPDASGREHQRRDTQRATLFDTFQCRGQTNRFPRTVVRDPSITKRASLAKDLAGETISTSFSITCRNWGAVATAVGMALALWFIEQMLKL